MLQIEKILEFRRLRANYISVLTVLLVALFCCSCKNHASPSFIAQCSHSLCAIGKAFKLELIILKPESTDSDYVEVEMRLVGIEDGIETSFQQVVNSHENKDELMKYLQFDLRKEISILMPDGVSVPCSALHHVQDGNLKPYATFLLIFPISNISESMIINVGSPRLGIDQKFVHNFSK